MAIFFFSFFFSDFNADKLKFLRSNIRVELDSSTIELCTRSDVLSIYIAYLNWPQHNQRVSIHCIRISICRSHIGPCEKKMHAKKGKEVRPHMAKRLDETNPLNLFLCPFLLPIYLKYRTVLLLQSSLNFLAY